METTDEHIGQLLKSLCEQALAEEWPPPAPARLFTRAPEGKSIAQGATTISLDYSGAKLLQQIVNLIQEDKDARIQLSEAEVEGEVVSALFEGCTALEERIFAESDLVKSLRYKLGEQRLDWDIYIPISGLELPSGRILSIAGGDLKRLTETDRRSLREQFDTALRTGRNTDSVVERVSGDFEETLTSSQTWFHVSIEGRPQGARDLATEKAVLAQDILRFWALLVGIDPQNSTLNFSDRTVAGWLKTFQIAKDGSWNQDTKRSVAFAYKLDDKRFEEMTSLPEFAHAQAMSNKDVPNQVDEKFLLAIQQFAEACQLPSPTLKIVWFLSALETVIVKESEGNRHKKVATRIGLLLGGSTENVHRLYDKRRKPVHYGHRNRIGSELVTDSDVQTAMTLAYLGIVAALQHCGRFTEHGDFVDALDALRNQKKPS